ncbi:unnamed protein product [Clonostachys rhizophaga]|uniref:Uncharacterized protein n=1 Tax=Clonostachys rhizophaga TaxID=160324 RepID=A0A9N9W200_9HYPO|nr:unnamed protein product [Clonostachys rhizophaga]
MHGALLVLARILSISDRLLKQAMEMMTNASGILADKLSPGKEGLDLAALGRYFRLNVPQGMEYLKMGDSKHMNKMKVLTLTWGIPVTETALRDIITSINRGKVRAKAEWLIGILGQSIQLLLMSHVLSSRMLIR